MNYLSSVGKYNFIISLVFKQSLLLLNLTLFIGKLYFSKEFVDAYF